jgi:hypothetical protein
MIKNLCFPHCVSGKDMQSSYHSGNFTKTPLNLAEIVFFSKYLFGFIERTKVEGIFATPLSHTIKESHLITHGWLGSSIRLIGLKNTRTFLKLICSSTLTHVVLQRPLELCGNSICSNHLSGFLEC